MTASKEPTVDPNAWNAEQAAIASFANSASRFVDLLERLVKMLEEERAKTKRY